MRRIKIFVQLSGAGWGN